MRDIPLVKILNRKSNVREDLARFVGVEALFGGNVLEKLAVGTVFDKNIAIRVIGLDVKKAEDAGVGELSKNNNLVVELGGGRGGVEMRTRYNFARNEFACVEVRCSNDTRKSTTAKLAAELIATNALGIWEIGHRTAAIAGRAGKGRRSTENRASCKYIS
jgi:hypothetical protein